ncbi:hypothetical protein [Actinomyces stomatis]|uniref:hypothetical protein n=1 Tax=Actinomyces stomatis TaxID=3050227 RepID=UPI0028525CA9|nr:hypothetical protein [Actinomyces sp. PK606]
MRVFVSGQFKEKRRVREAFQVMEAAGHVITYDWTRTEALEKPYSLYSVEASRRAREDINGILSADTFVLMSDNRECGKGMYVELGAALAMAELRSKQIRVYIVGPMNHESIFYYHPLVVHKETLEEVVSLCEA